MNCVRPPGAVTCLDLGGGFSFVQRADGASAIVVSALIGSGSVGLMSAAPLNARRKSELSDWLRNWGLPRAMRLRKPNQVHGDRIVHAPSIDESRPVQADGAWTSSPGEALCIVSADCAPIWVAARERKALALIHAGWRGVVAGAVGNAIRALNALGVRSSSLSVAIGPHLGPCCFEVGPEVADQFRQTNGTLRPAESLLIGRQRTDSSALDLSAAILAQLDSAGVERGEVSIATACTRCTPGVLHSYRRNGRGGPLMAAIGFLEE